MRRMRPDFLVRFMRTEDMQPSREFSERSEQERETSR